MNRPAPRPITDYCTAFEAAKIANVTTRRITQLLASGAIDGIRIGGRWLVLRESVYRWLRQR